MKKKLVLILLSVCLFALTPSNKLYAQNNCRQILNSGIQAFINANFEETVNYLSQIKNNAEILQDCDLEDREKVEFYNSYSLYLLYGCQDQRTYQALCDLKLHCPSFSLEKEEYQWITQDWAVCWNNADCFTGPIISYIYSNAKYFFEQDFPIQAAAEIMILFGLTENGQKLPPECPECLQYISSATDYLTSCESRINEKWMIFFANSNFRECLELEQKIIRTEGLQTYLPGLIENLSNKKTEFIETINNEILNESVILINQIRTSLFTVPDLSQLQMYWAQIKNIKEIYNENNLTLSTSETIQQIQALADQVIPDFQRYGDNLIQHYDIRQEEIPRLSLENYKAALEEIFPQQQADIESTYQKIIESPPPIFNTNSPGVIPPVDDGKWKIPQLECLKKIYLTGDVLCGITIDDQGKVETVTVISKRFNIENDCTNRLIEELSNYILEKEFIPAQKTMNCSGFVTPSNRNNRESINVKYFLVKKLRVG